MLEAWCEPPAEPATQDRSQDLFTRVNAGWLAAHPDARPSLLRALADEADARCTSLIEELVDGESTGTGPEPVLSGLHRIFVSQFDPVAERDCCLVDVAQLSAITTREQMLTTLADMTRRGYCSPLHLQVRSSDHGTPVVVPLLHPAPLPPTDFDDDARLSAYVRHMTVMTGHVGAPLSDERFRELVALDRALWVAPAQDEPEHEFPWETFLQRAVGPRARPWSVQIGVAVRRRMTAWWAGDLQQQRDWMIGRLAYDLGPFVSEAALIANATFFAGRVLGLTRPRSRPERLVSFVKTVDPDSLAQLYANDRYDPVLLDRARTIFESLREQALAWAASVSGPGGVDPAVVATLQTLSIELGEQPKTGPGAGSADVVPPTVCDGIKAARAAAVDDVLALIDDPVRDADWKVQAFTASAYHQRSSNKVVVPWALIREPLLGPQLSDVQAYAMFGTLVAHEMAHAVLPSSTAGWPGFVAGAGLEPVLQEYRAATGPLEHRFTVSHHRELAADALGYAWARDAFLTVVEPPADDQRFLDHWATRWRGIRPVGGAGSAHIEQHPPAVLRCNIAPSMVSRKETMNWERDLEAAWADLDSLEEDEFMTRILDIVAGPSVPAQIREFEIACAHDSTGHSDLAVPAYRRALSMGLSGYRARRAKIQLASSLRNVGHADESVEILTAESTTVGDGLDDAVAVFLALALVDTGREREAVAGLVHALAEHLPRYTASSHRYADALIAPVAQEPVTTVKEVSGR